MSSSSIPSASTIPSLSAEELTPLLTLLTLLPTSISSRLSQQSAQAISDLPVDARPNSYDGLVDVARFCLEEEPGQEHWDLDTKLKLLSSVAEEIKSQSLAGKMHQLGEDADEGELQRLSQLSSLYQQRFPSLSYLPPTTDSWNSTLYSDLSSILGPTISALATDSSTPTLPTSDVLSQSSPEYEAEMERNFESFWTIAGERASKITSGELRFPEPAATITTSSPTSETKAPPVAVGQDVPFLSLATFRMLVLSSPVLETFFERDLASSFILTEPERSETGGVFAWHSAAPGANRLVPGSKEALNSKTFSSDLSSELGVGSGNYAYSKDVTPGARGKALGFLGGLLGEEGKMRMNQIVDNVGQRLQTTTVVGPKPSFGNNKTTLDGNRIDTDEIKMKEEDDARRNGGISGLTRWGLGARLADAVRGQTGTASSTTSNPNSPAPRGRPAQRVTTLQSQAQAQAQAKRNSLRGLDLSSSGPAGAAESLRAAAAAIQERSHFVIDEPSAAEGDVTQDGEGDEVEDGEGEALLTEERAEERGEITGKEAQMAKELRTAPAQR